MFPHPLGRDRGRAIAAGERRRRLVDGRRLIVLGRPQFGCWARVFLGSTGEGPGKATPSATPRRLRSSPTARRRATRTSCPRCRSRTTPRSASGASSAFRATPCGTRGSCSCKLRPLPPWVLAIHPLPAGVAAPARATARHRAHHRRLPARRGAGGRARLRPGSAGLRAPVRRRHPGRAQGHRPPLPAVCGPPCPPP